MAALCEHIANDAFLARICLTNDFPAGQNGARSRRRLISAVTELLQDDTTLAGAAADLPVAASTGAIWSLFHHHVARNRTTRGQIAATLSYLALAPAVGAQVALRAIRSEQAP